MKTILVIDDDDAFREMMRVVLESNRFNVHTAGSTAEGLILTAVHGLDAVLTDYQMPQTDGVAFCRALKKQNRVLDRRLPVWLMTGSVTISDDEAVAAGAEAVFRKPFSAPEIARRILVHLQNARAESASAIASK